MADIEHKHDEKQGMFLARSNNEVIGEMTYHMQSSEIMAIEHTQVNPSERGNNLGLELLNAAVSHARQHDLKIRPVCKFVNVMFRKNEKEYADVTLNDSL